MIIKNNFGHRREVLLIFLKNGFSFLYEGYKIVLSNKKYDLKKDGSNLENTIRDDIYREATKLLKIAALKNRDDKYLKFKFYNENRDIEDKNDVKRFDISLNYDSAPHSNDIVIECKRLDKKLKNKAYIDNGVNRFVTNRYGYGLPVGGMIGFIEKGKRIEIVHDLSEKLTKRASTIKNLTLVNVDAFTFSDTYKNNIFLSAHDRGKPWEKIELYHLFMDFSSIIK